MPRKRTDTTNKVGQFDPLGDPKDGHILTRAIIDTIHEPLIILDEQLRVIAASRSFYDKFGQRASKIQGKRFYEIGNGEWNIEPLKKLLEKVIPDHKTVDSYEVEYEFPTLGKRVLLVNACEIRYDNGRKKCYFPFLISVTGVFLSSKEKSCSFIRTCYSKKCAIALPTVCR